MLIFFITDVEADSNLDHLMKWVMVTNNHFFQSPLITLPAVPFWTFDWREREMLKWGNNGFFFFKKC